MWLSAGQLLGLERHAYDRPSTLELPTAIAIRGRLSLLESAEVSRM